MKRILIIDDDPNIAELLQVRLQSNGFETFTASDGMEGFVKAKSLKPDLVIMDVIMPNLDGYSLFQEFKWDPELRNLPILVLTGKTDLKSIFEDKNVIKFMHKPFDSKELLDYVNFCLNTN